MPRAPPPHSHQRPARAVCTHARHPHRHPTPREAATRGLSLPAWARALLALRNALVRPFGLKTGDDTDPIFPTCLDTEDELILGTDDRHLDFRIGLIRQEGRIYMSTWVHPHNGWGRAYLTLVMPFHILISRGAVARMAR